jgi:hypothetical protein
MTYQSEVLRSMIHPNTAHIFTKRHIKHPMNQGERTLNQVVNNVNHG